MTKIFGTHDANTLDQMSNVAKSAEHTALMADGHFGYIMPVGGVAAYRTKVSVSGVGYDIGCGNTAFKLDVRGFELLARDRVSIADTIAGTISFGVGRKNLAKNAPEDDPIFTDSRWEEIQRWAGVAATEKLRALARTQLGTVGSGNHYVDVFLDEEDYVWVGVHFGSRGLGHTIASNFMAIAAGGNWGDKYPESETLLDAYADDLGESYIRAMQLAGQYAGLGRRWVCNEVADIIGARVIDTVENHHNYAWLETHFGEEFWVVRKGATPAFPGQRGFVGGSMGDISVILSGARTASDTAHQALFSTVHGAGRVMSRMEAKGKFAKDGTIKREPRVTLDMMREATKNVIVRGGGVDESPHVYRKLMDVLTAQEDTITIEHVLTPIIVVMAGANDFDPYKD